MLYSIFTVDPGIIAAIEAAKAAKAKAREAIAKAKAAKDKEAEADARKVYEEVKYALSLALEARNKDASPFHVEAESPAEARKLYDGDRAIIGVQPAPIDNQIIDCGQAIVKSVIKTMIRNGNMYGFELLRASAGKASKCDDISDAYADLVSIAYCGLWQGLNDGSGRGEYRAYKRAFALVNRKIKREKAFGASGLSNEIESEKAAFVSDLFGLTSLHSEAFEARLSAALVDMTPRMRHALNLRAKGFSTTTIAAKMHISQPAALKNLKNARAAAVKHFPPEAVKAIAAADTKAKAAKAAEVESAKALISEAEAAARACGESIFSVKKAACGEAAEAAARKVKSIAAKAKTPLSEAFAEAEAAFESAKAAAAKAEAEALSARRFDEMEAREAREAREAAEDKARAEAIARADYRKRVEAEAIKREGAIATMCLLWHSEAEAIAEAKRIDLINDGMRKGLYTPRMLSSSEAAEAREAAKVSAAKARAEMEAREAAEVRAAIAEARAEIEAREAPAKARAEAIAKRKAREAREARESYIYRMEAKARRAETRASEARAEAFKARKTPAKAAIEARAEAIAKAAEAAAKAARRALAMEMRAAK